MQPRSETSRFPRGDPTARARSAIALVITITLAGSCSSGNEVDETKLRSDAREARSIAAEGRLLAERALAGHLTDAYRRGHAEYLEHQLDQLDAEIRDASAAPGRADDLKTIRESLKASRPAFEAMSAGGADEFERAKDTFERAAASLERLAPRP
jgi:hypothetical protein